MINKIFLKIMPFMGMWKNTVERTDYAHYIFDN
jgi:hypothetical protein